MAVDMGIPDVEGAEEIGRGGFGVVYRAEQRRFDRTVAVKVLEQAQLDEAGRQRFERECKALGALSGHPNVVTIYDSGFTPNAGWPYLVLEYLPDGSLSDRVDRDGPIDIDQTTELIIKICGALETAHRSGVLHRDMKPENILMGPYDEPKLGDFGIARVQGATMTATSTIWGSPAHAAPEIIEGKGASPQTDIYSLGSTLYVLLSGKLAFQRDTDESIIPVLARIATEPPPDLRPLGVPEAVWWVLARSMAKDPTDRQPTAMDVGKELQQARLALGLDVVEMRVKGEQSTRRTLGGSVTPGATPAPTTVVSGAAPATYSPPVGSPPPGAPSVPSFTPPPTYTPPPGSPPPSATPVPTYTPAAYSPAPGTAPTGYGPPPGATPGGYASGPIGPYTTTGGAPPAGGSGRLWIIAAVAVVLLAVLGIGVFVATRPSTSGPTSSLVAQPPGTKTAAPGTEDTVDTDPPSTPVSLKTALLTPATMPGTAWSVSADASSFNGFSFLEPCNKQADASTLTQQEKTLLSGKNPGGQQAEVFQAVGEFDSEDAAKSFIDDIPDQISCHTWTDSTGEDHDIIVQSLNNPVSDQSLLLEDIVTDSGTEYDHDIAFYREGAFVGFVTNLTVKPNDEAFTEQLLGLADDQLKSAIG